MMRRRFRRTSKPIWTITNTLGAENGQSVPVYGSLTWWYTVSPIIPAARVKWLCEQMRKKSLLVTGILCWFDFYWSNVGGQTGLADTDIYIQKFTEDAAGEASQFFDPFGEIQVPSAITNWGNLGQSTDALDPFLWRHHIKGQSPPNALVATYGTGTSSVTNQIDLIGAGTSDAPANVCRKFNVTQEWQPDVRVKTRRSLHMNEGLMIGMLNRQSTVPGSRPQLDFRMVLYGR